LSPIAGDEVSPVLKILASKGCAEMLKDDEPAEWAKER
jgi:hypothetical protein